LLRFARNDGQLLPRRLALSFYFIQFVTGLASACSLFLVAYGLSIIFGVTRILNFAHGAFYMLGASSPRSER
jgi:branched-subunit amino acid ABC-type transport system permease component